MSWVRIVIVVSWAVVFAGWVYGISRTSPKLIKRIENPWECRLFGITAFCILLVSIVDVELVQANLDVAPVYWPAWAFFLSGPILYYWARIELDGSWSSEAQISEATRLVDGGPYALMRHPIYFSKTLMAYSSSLILMNWVILALSCVLLSTAIYQARIEESLLAKNLPQYREYRNRVPMFLAFGLSEELGRHAKAWVSRLIGIFRHPPTK